MLQQILPFHDVMIPELVIGNANVMAYRALFEQTPLPFGVHWLQGEDGAGKSVLADYWKRSKQANIIELDADITLSIAPLECYVLDPLPESSVLHVSLFHLLNQIHVMQARLLVCSHYFPHNYPTNLQDLSSRLKAAYVHTLIVPDDTMLKGILLTHAAMRQFRLEPELLDYIISRMQRTCSGAAQLIAALDAYNLHHKYPITLPVVRHVMEELYSYST
jgi:hypothetical protein